MVHHLFNDLYWWFRIRSSLFVISLFLFVCCHPSSASFSGGLVNIYTRLTIADSPFHIRDHVYVEKNAELRIDPGVILYFSPRKGITVKGRLTAKGTNEDKILFTIAPNSNAITNFQQAGSPGSINKSAYFNNQPLISSTTNWPNARLVDGHKPSEGRLQIYYRNKWQSVCTSSKNWTEIDTTTVCRQLGFNKGYWYQWFSRNNESHQFMLEAPGCLGNEPAISECINWNKRAVGSGICDYHMDIGIRCDEEFYYSPNYWAGLKFLDAQSEIVLIRDFDDKVSRQVSKSVLENIVIEYAGEDAERKATPAIQSIGIPPAINQVSVKWSASTAVNITDPKDAVVVSNSYFFENRGYGLFFNTSYGSVELNNVKIERNAADGLRYVLHEDHLIGHDFCQFTKHGQTQIYPVRLTHEQIERSLSGRQCCQTFELPKALEEARLTLHFSYVMNDNIWTNEEEERMSEDGFVEVFDGYKQEKIAKFYVRNSTHPSSFTSSTNRIQVCYTPSKFKKSTFTMVAIAGHGKAYDLNVTRSEISSNNGRGIWLENSRSGLVVNHTQITNNSYIAGLHATFGSGDLIVNNTIIKNNIGDGLNVSLSNGYRHIDRSVISSNSKRGIAFYFNETIDSLYTGSHQFAYQITYSEIQNNLDVGLLLGNVCRSDAFWNISMNHFAFNLNDALQFQSCWEPAARGRQKIYITHNSFLDNQQLAINMAPLFHTKRTLIKNNLFKFNKKGGIYINNFDYIYDDVRYEAVEARVKISENYFLQNYGYFVVNIGLNENNRNQEIVFTNNWLKDNSVREPYSKLNPRSRVSAVVAVSSSNTRIFRNNLMNPDSRFEIGVHLEHHSKQINATFNYFGALSSQRETLEIYRRIFDRKNRYNLAFVEYQPYRTDEYDFDTNELISSEQERDKRINFYSGDKLLGGEIRGIYNLPPGTYRVNNDIYVAPNSVLSLRENTVLEFDYSIGMMIQGELEIKTSISSPIVFRGSADLLSSSGLKKDFFDVQDDFGRKAEEKQTIKQPAVVAFANLTNSAGVPNANGTISLANGTSSTAPVRGNSDESGERYYLNKRKKREHEVKVTNVRLSNGTEGRVEVQVNGQWGSVCSYKFDLVDATIVCQQLGYVLNAKDWQLSKNQFMSSNSLDYVILSNLRCTKFDWDLSLCQAERRRDDFEGSCFSEVGIKCSLPSWSGLRFGMAAKSSSIENILIENSGLLDYSTNKFKPALQIDFNRHKFKNLKITNNRDSGLGIMWNNIFGEEDLTISNSDISANEKHGIVSASQGIQIKNCHISNNKGSGIHYQPMFTNYEQRDLVSWISAIESQNLISLPKHLSRYRSHANNMLPTINIKPHQSWFIQIERPERGDQNFTFQIETQIGYSIGIIVINSINPLFTDNLQLRYRGKEWDLRSNLSSFTMNHFVFKFTLDYSSGPNPVGDIILFLYSKPILVLQSKSLAELEEEENFRIKTIKIEGNRLVNNRRGFSSHHYNKDQTQFGEQYFHRYDNETFLIKDNSFEHNQQDALYVNSLIYDPSYARISEINYTLIRNEFKNNRKAIVHESNNVGNSNNLFHWTLNQSRIELGTEGGVSLQLPYCWQYNENYTHTINVHNNTMFKNRNFEFNVDGHFAKLNMSRNVFRENNCRVGLATIAGMEKELHIHDNVIENNYGEYMFEFNLQSHADKFGLVRARFERNRILNNRNHFLIKPLISLRPFNYALSVRGVQYINITRNLINNPELNYEFLVGVLTGSINNRLNIRENWWGTHNSSQIKDRIFDFDDWNSYALANYTPYLASENLDSIAIDDDELNLYKWVNLNQPLGGRLNRNLTLPKRNLPYIVKSDLTIMPGYTLQIHPGATLEFYPNVGILALGNLDAVGSPDEPIIMRPIEKDVDLLTVTRLTKREVIPNEDKKFSKYTDLSNIRLCKSVYCDEWLPNAGRKDGFLEIYNSTTLQWIPICDSTFTERNAEVVCHQLGYSTLNVHLKFGKRLNMDLASVSRVQHWPQTLECNGKENKISECNIRANSYEYYSNICEQEGENFVYIYCGDEFKQNENDYWGGIRFTLGEFENRNRENFYLPSRNNFNSNSRLYYANIINAGLLHGEKSAAVQIVQRDVNLGFLTINGSASHALEVISPSGHLMFEHLNIHNNLGHAMNYLLLDGAANKNLNLPYKPTKQSTLPYNVFSLADICDINKNLVVDQRIIVYYKYDSRPVDCVKIFKSSRASEKVSFRLLQFSLFNSTNIVDQTDFIHVYDGDLFNYTSSKLIADLGVSEQHRLKAPQDHFYQSSLESLSVRLHASGARGEYGFIAEIVTSTSSHHFGGALFNNITHSLIENNVKGGLVYKSVGETTPMLSLLHNTVKSNCLQMYGNFTTCDSALDIEVQNSPFVLIDSNLITENIGGVALTTNAYYLGAALKGSLVSNNLFVQNLVNSVLNVKALVDNDFFQLVNVYRNYFTRNIAPYHTNVIISGMLCNFTQNIVVKNTGLHQLKVLGFDRSSHLYQEIRGNWLYNNLATLPNKRSTIIANSAGQHYIQNYFVNPDNDYEMSSVNRSLLKQENYFIDAKENWWGDNSESTIKGRIKDYLDNPGYIEVNYQNYLTKNSSVLSGICAGGWHKIGETCFYYVTARMGFQDAQRFCEQENSTMPFVSTNYDDITAYLYQQNDNYDKRFWPIWVQSFQYSTDECTALINERIEPRTCGEKLTFICEKDPLVRPLATVYDNWYKDSLMVTVLIVSTTIASLAFICVCCWLCKSRARHNEKLQRRNSIRASIRSNRSYSMSINSLNEIAYKKQIEKAIQMAREQQNQQQQQQHQQQQYQNNFNNSNTLNDNYTNSMNDQLIQMPNYPPTVLGKHSSSTFRMNNLNPNGSYESFTDNNSISNHPQLASALHSNHNTAFVNDSSFEEESTHNYNTLRTTANELEDRFVDDPRLENANIKMLIKPTFDLTYENAGFKETPSLSRNSEYADARNWSPVSNHALNNQVVSQYPMGQYIKRKTSGAPPPSAPHHHLINNNPTAPSHHHNSLGKKPSNKPLPPVARYRQSHQQQQLPPHHQPSNSGSNSTIQLNPNGPPSQMTHRKSLPSDYDSGIDHYNHQTKNGFNHNPDLYAFQSRSQSTLLGGSDITSVSQNSKFLETSLDNDSIADNNIDYYENQSNRQYSPNTSITTACTNRSLPPLETAM